MKEVYYHDVNTNSILVNIHLKSEENGVRWNPIDNPNSFGRYNLKNKLLIVNPTYNELNDYVNILKKILDDSSEAKIFLVTPNNTKEDLESRIGNNYKNITFFCKEEKWISLRNLEKNILEAIQQ